MLSTLGLSAALLCAAEAIIIPSTISLPALSTGPLSIAAIDPHSQILKVGCPGCQFAQKDASDRLTWTQGVENALVLNISVGAQPETMELNGVRFYPPVLSLSMENPVPYIPQVPADMSMAQIKSHAKELAKNALRLTGWAFQAGRSQTVSESGEELLTIHLQLNALERQEINVPDIAITMLKNGEGELMIMKIETQDKSTVSPVDNCQDWPLLCKWRSIIANKFNGLKGMGMGKGCGKEKRPHGHKGLSDAAVEGVEAAPWMHGPPTNMHHGPNSHHDGASESPEQGHGGKHGHGPPWRQHGRPGHHGRPHGHHGWHHPHRHHHKWHKALHVVGRVLLTVFVPILLGVAAGMVTYLLGMFIGAIVAAVYMKVRGRRARYQAVALDEDETPRCSLEKDSYKEEDAEEALPLYVEKE